MSRIDLCGPSLKRTFAEARDKPIISLTKMDGQAIGANPDDYRLLRAIWLEVDVGELFEQGTEGFASMGEFPFFFARQFGESEVEGREKEKRIIAEAGVTPGLVQDLAFNGAFGAEEDLAVSGEGQGADEAG
jgi:hypothetical protein